MLQAAPATNLSRSVGAAPDLKPHADHGKTESKSSTPPKTPGTSPTVKPQPVPKARISPVRVSNGRRPAPSTGPVIVSAPASAPVSAPTSPTNAEHGEHGVKRMEEESALPMLGSAPASAPAPSPTTASARKRAAPETMKLAPASAPASAPPSPTNAKKTESGPTADADYLDDASKLKGVRRRWTALEDTALVSVMDELALKGINPLDVAWDYVSRLIRERASTKRSARQCRERWHNHIGIATRSAPMRRRNRTVPYTSTPGAGADAAPSRRRTKREGRPQKRAAKRPKPSPPVMEDPSQTSSAMALLHLHRAREAPKAPSLPPQRDSAQPPEPVPGRPSDAAHRHATRFPTSTGPAHPMASYHHAHTGSHAAMAHAPGPVYMMPHYGTVVDPTRPGIVGAPSYAYVPSPGPVAPSPMAPSASGVLHAQAAPPQHFYMQPGTLQYGNPYYAAAVPTPVPDARAYAATPPVASHGGHPHSGVLRVTSMQPPTPTLTSARTPYLYSYGVPVSRAMR